MNAHYDYHIQTKADGHWSTYAIRRTKSKARDVVKKIKGEVRVKMVATSIIRIEDL